MIIHRRIGEAVHIREILVEVLAATSRGVQLRVTAPAGTQIVRREQLANVSRQLSWSPRLVLPFQGTVS